MKKVKRLSERYCRNCGSILTFEERCFYEYRCEKCESEWFERIEAWRRGADDPEFDAIYGVPAGEKEKLT